MTLLIACFLIYHMNLDSWWYAVAVFLWLAHLVFRIYLAQN